MKILSTSRPKVYLLSQSRKKTTNTQIHQKQEGRMLLQSDQHKKIVLLQKPSIGFVERAEHIVKQIRAQVKEGEKTFNALMMAEIQRQQEPNIQCLLTLEVVKEMLQNGAVAKAGHLLRSAIPLYEKKNVQPQYQIELIYQKLQCCARNQEDGAEYAKKGLDLIPQGKRKIYFLRILSKSLRPAEAINRLRKGIRLFPEAISPEDGEAMKELSLAYAQLSQAYLLDNDCNSALETAENAVKIFSQYPSNLISYSLKNLIFVTRKAKGREEALKQTNELITFFTEDEGLTGVNVTLYIEKIKLLFSKPTTKEDEWKPLLQKVIKYALSVDDKNYIKAISGIFIKAIYSPLATSSHEFRNSVSRCIRDGLGEESDKHTIFLKILRREKTYSDWLKDRDPVTPPIIKERKNEDLQAS